MCLWIRGSVTGQLLSTLKEQESFVAMAKSHGENRSSRTRRDLGCHASDLLPTSGPGQRLDDFRALKFIAAFDGGRMTRRGVKLIAERNIPRPRFAASSGDAAAIRRVILVAESTPRWLFCRCVVYPRRPEQVVTRAIEEREADLLIMGAYSHSPWRLLMGSAPMICSASQVPR